jgi:predicted AAA+ superfamily ATPase
LFKDVVQRYEIHDPAKLNDLAVFLLTAFASRFTLNSLARHFDYSSVVTVGNYLQYLEYPRHRAN